MFYFILTVHLLLCVGLIFLVLLQQGKGADLGAAFGGSQAAFGPGGAVNTVGRVTTALAIAFMITSIVLVRAYSSVTPLVQMDQADPLRGSVMEGAQAPAEEPIVADDEQGAEAAQADAAAADEKVEVQQIEGAQQDKQQEMPEDEAAVADAG